jgi:hypothetical protein
VAPGHGRLFRVRPLNDLGRSGDSAADPYGDEHHEHENEDDEADGRDPGDDAFSRGDVVFGEHVEDSRHAGREEREVEQDQRTEPHSSCAVPTPGWRAAARSERRRRLLPPFQRERGRAGSSGRRFGKRCNRPSPWALLRRTSRQPEPSAPTRLASHGELSPGPRAGRGRPSQGRASRSGWSRRARASVGRAHEPRRDVADARRARARSGRCDGGPRRGTQLARGASLSCRRRVRARLDRAATAGKRRRRSARSSRVARRLTGPRASGSGLRLRDGAIP